MRGIELQLFESYLTGRYQFTQLDTFNSTIEKSLDCSVIQGRKVSGLLYSIYTNEILLVNKLISNPLYNVEVNRRKINELENV